MLCDDQNRKEIQKRGDICIGVTDPRCCQQELAEHRKATIRKLTFFFFLQEGASYEPGTVLTLNISLLKHSLSIEETEIQRT